MKWKCHIPGKEKTDWEGGFYPLTMEFTEDYPTKPPKVCTHHGVGTVPVAWNHTGPTPTTRSVWLMGGTCALCQWLIQQSCLPLSLPFAVQVSNRVLPPQHLPVRHSVPKHIERGAGLIAFRMQACAVGVDLSASST